MMKWMSCLLLLLPLTLQAEEPAPVSTDTPAATLVADALEKAEAESKLVFMKSGWPGCGYCRIFDKSCRFAFATVTHHQT